LQAAQRLAAAWEVALPAPAAMLGAMAALPLPEALQGRAAGEIHDALWERWRVEVPVLEIGGRRWVRISGQAYNGPADYETLGEAVLELGAEA